jgi:uncharacterized membrane protein YqiK
MFVKAQPHQYLVLARGGCLHSRGIAGRAWLWPGSSHALVDATKQEARFAMTQETRDGIPLRFKGMVIYRVVDPVAAVRQFGFADEDGHDAIKELLEHLCLGELRAVVSHMTMEQCIEQRESTLTDRVAGALHRVTGVGGERAGWGLELDVVQVAQVFIVDEELRRQLEAEVRDRIKVTSDLSQIRTQEQVQRAQIESARALQRQEMESERARHEMEREKLRLRQALEAEQVAAAAEAQALQSAKRREVLAEERATRRLAVEVKALEVEEGMLLRRAKQALRREILPQEQVTEIAQALSKIFRGANLSIYGSDSELVSTVLPAIRLIGDQLRRAVRTDEGGT